VTRVLVVDDHPVFRDGLTGLLATMDGIEVAGSVGTAEAALEFCATDPPDVVLMDVNLPGASGVAATDQLTRTGAGPAVLMVTMVDDDDTVLNALGAGARGYLLKDATPEEIHAALRTVVAGGAVLGSGIATRLVNRRPSRVTAMSELTNREREILDLLARGRTNPQIARTLGISVKTVQNTVSRVLDKLQVTDRTQAALKARQLRDE
jgi:DNA-binding NarL/FixJ family response regulator